MKFIIASIFILISFATYSQTEQVQSSLRVIEVRLSLQDQASKILLGSEEPIKLELSGEIPIHFFQVLVNDKFIFDDGVYLSQVKALAVTKPGFSQVFEAKAAFAKTIVPNTKFNLDLVQMGVQLQFINLNIEVFNDPEVAGAKTPQVVDQNLSTVPSYLIEFIVVILLLIAGVIGWLIFTKKQHTKNAIKRKRQEWLELIEKAKSRRDYELVYANSNYWKDYISFDKKKYGLFSELVLRNQYREKWSPELLSDVQMAYMKMIQSLDQNQQGRK